MLLTKREKAAKQPNAFSQLLDAADHLVAGLNIYPRLFICNHYLPLFLSGRFGSGGTIIYIAATHHYKKATILIGASPRFIFDCHRIVAEIRQGNQNPLLTFLAFWKTLITHAIHL